MPNHVAVVTGASSGIGEATAQRLHGLDYVVYGLARRVDRMADLAELGVRTLAVDVTDERATAAAVEQIVAEQGRVDVLVNNAGYGSYGALEDVPLSEARYQFEVNVFGLARLIQLVLPHMRRQGRGRLINISSIGGKIYEPLGDWYHAAKFAVEGLSDSLRVELRPFGIDVIIIEPGGIRTEWGAISAQKLRQASAGTAYQKQAETMAAVLESLGPLASPPSVVADTIARAATARRPRTRYLTGRGARAAVTARQVLPDRAFDAVISSGYQMAGKWATRQRHTATEPAPQTPV
ncbi:MAG TPA: oxidoreductase [Streptosporangiaceae bacterium]|nr:oxidoreductase [Streptosporangiaceae bacterium]